MMLEDLKRPIRQQLDDVSGSDSKTFQARQQARWAAGRTIVRRSGMSRLLSRGEGHRGANRPMGEPGCLKKEHEQKRTQRTRLATKVTPSPGELARADPRRVVERRVPGEAECAVSALRAERPPP